MRQFTIALVLAASITSTAATQQADSSRGRPGLPQDIAREAARLYNEPAALRATEPTEIADGQVVDGDVAVLNGPLTIGGRVRGRVLAINSDVILRPNSRIDGDLLVVGGVVEGRHSAFIGGETRIYRERLRYAQNGDLLEPEVAASSDETGWWRRWNDRPRRSGSKLQVASAGAYNRVEGLPINLGPQVFQRLNSGSLKVDAYAVIRTQTSFDGTRGGDIGHNINAELRLGRRGGPIIGAQLFDVVEPTQTWQLSELEAGLASFLVRRDYRDYFARHGGQARVGFFLRRGVDLTTAYSHERWSSRQDNDPWSLFRTGIPWRPNPTFDDGVMHLINNTLRIDTRNDSWSPWSGWYMVADLEHEFGHLTSSPACTVGPCPPLSHPLYSARGVVDLRRYNRLSPNAQLNFRLVAGGRLNGDPLPTQRRFAVDGPGVLPGFGFRSTPNANTATCDSPSAGTPGMCERMMLLQAEYRGDLHLDLFGDWDDGYTRSGADGVWVFFMDAGRGWLLGSVPNQVGYGLYEIPSFSTFRSDLGLGLDFELFGLFAAKALNDASESVNYFLRIRHRF